MCNYYCVYCHNPSKLSFCKEYLSKNCRLVRGLKFVFMNGPRSPSLASMPEPFKRAGFGLHPGCYAIVCYNGDNAQFKPNLVFDPVYSWFEHVYSQDKSCEDWIDNNMGVKAQFASGVRRPVPRPLFYRAPDADSQTWDNIQDEIARLKEQFAGELAARKAYIWTNRYEIANARRSLQRIESGIHRELTAALFGVPPNIQTPDYIARVTRLVERKYLGEKIRCQKVLDSIPKKPIAYVSRKRFLKHELGVIAERTWRESHPGEPVRKRPYSMNPLDPPSDF